MAKIHPHRYREPGPYVEIFERVIEDLWKICEHVLKESEWCLVLPGLFDQRDKFLVPVKAMPARPGQGGSLFLSGAGRGQGGSSFLSGAGRGQGGSLFPPGADAGQGGSLFPPGADAGQGGSSFQQKEPQKRAAPDYASGPPSSSSSEKIQKVLPPPPPKGKEPSVPIGGKIPPIGAKMPPRDPWADVVDDSSVHHPEVPVAMPHRTCTAPLLPPPAKRWNAVERSAEFGGDVAPPKELSHPVAKTNWGPKPPSYPPPKAASSVPAQPKNRWNRSRSRLPFLLSEQQRATMAEQQQPVASRTRSRENVPPPKAPTVNDAAARASSSTDPTPDEAASDPPTPPKVSEVPKVLEEEQIEYNNYKQYVKGIVEKWLTGKEQQTRANKNPNFKQNGLTNFLLMFAISSFLEVAKDAALEVYRKLYGDKEDWFRHDWYVQIRSLTMTKFCKHGKQGMVWRYLESIGVKNFEPEEPADIEGWKNWLSASQLFQLMEWCFENFWRDEIDYKNKMHRKMQLFDHVRLYWDWYCHIFTVQAELKNMTQPYPSGWTWEGYMKRQKAKLTELAVQTFRKKICNAESLAKLHTTLFARKVGAFEQVDVEFDQHGKPADDYVLQTYDQEEEEWDW